MTVSLTQHLCRFTREKRKRGDKGNQEDLKVSLIDNDMPKKTSDKMLNR